MIGQAPTKTPHGTTRVTPRAGLTSYSSRHHALLLAACGPLLQVHEETRDDLSMVSYLSIAGQKADDRTFAAFSDLVFIQLIEIAANHPSITSHGLGVLMRLNRERGLTVPSGGAP